ncbi:MAG: hypothetical protein IJ666_06190 [Ruminococcus sp.]|nr:hypothetical protein [Ruminococcus sp.]
MQSDSKFIRTVTFGGFDKNDVNKRLNSLYRQIYELKNELRETKLKAEKYKNGTSEEKTHEIVLGEERKKLTELQVQNEEISEKLKSTAHELIQKDEKIKALEKENNSLRNELKDAKNEIEGLRAGDDDAEISTVFMEAKKSADLIKASANEKAKATEENTRKLCENTIKDADNQAARIIYEAERKAAETEADALNKAEIIKASSDNLRASMAKDVAKIYKEIADLKKAFEVFAEEGYSLLDDSENLLKKTDGELRRGEVPVFRVPGHIEPKYPDEPEFLPVDHDYVVKEETVKPPKPENPENSSNSLDKLQQMAAALEDDTKPEKTDNSTSARNKNDKKGGGIDLDALMQQAAALDE